MRHTEACRVVEWPKGWRIDKSSSHAKKERATQCATWDSMNVKIAGCVRKAMFIEGHAECEITLVAGKDLVLENTFFDLLEIREVRETCWRRSGHST